MKHFLSCKMFSLLFLVAGAVFLLTGSLWARSLDYINVNNPTLKRTPIALPKFKTFSNAGEEEKIAENARHLLEKNLAFLGYLRILDSAGFLANPAETGVGIQDIRFSDWTGIGADLLVTGGLEYINSWGKDRGMIKIQLRLFDTYTRRLVVGKIYTGPKSRLRKMIHMFCGEVSHALTGKWGVFTSRLAFVATVGKKKEIFVSEFDGFGIEQVSHHRSIALSPAWSCDAEWIAYVCYAKKKPDLYIKRVRDRAGAIVARKGLNITPDWTPNALQLAATLSFSGRQEIYLLTRKGEIIKKLSDSWGINVSPRFSPDGRKLAFVSNRTGAPQIYIKDLDSGQIRRLTFQGNYNTSPAWSPDGSRIAYVGIDRNKINIFVIPTDSMTARAPMQLTWNQGDNEDPCFSPDGSMIAFSSNRGGQGAKIFVMTSTGADQRQLFSMKGVQTQPKWSAPVHSDR